jgi:exopolyphosphatase/guanosine-5'-triphosphate,3'-diphosphate pyrophosphatase
LAHARVAAIDIGTNSVLLAVAEVETGGELRPVVERSTITRLGSGVDASGELSAASCKRTLACLHEYSRELRAAGAARVAVVGTSALRDARNGEHFLRDATGILGVRPEVIGGQREAALTFRGALSALDVSGSVLVFDVGGGSTEVIRGSVRSDGATAHAGQSLDVGSVRLFERHLHSDPPSSTEIAALRADVRKALRSLPAVDGALDLVGVAGTATTLAAIAHELASYDPGVVHGCRLGRETVRELAARLSALPLRARREVAGLEPQRADIITAGAWISLELVDHLGGGVVTVSDRGVRWGLLHELAS